MTNKTGHVDDAAGKPAHHASPNKFVFKQEHFLAARLFISVTESNPNMPQAAFAQRIGVSSPNTYAKWERGVQEAPSVAVAAVAKEIQIALLFKANPGLVMPSIDPFIEHVRRLPEGYGANIRMRSSRADESAERNAFAFFKLCPEVTRQEDGTLFIPQASVTMTPGYTRNKRLKSYGINCLEKALCDIEDRDFAELKPTASESILKASNEGQTKFDTTFFKAVRTGDNLVITFKKKAHITALNKLLASVTAADADITGDDDHEDDQK